MLLGQISIFYMFLVSAANELWQTMETMDVDGVLRAALPVRTQLSAGPPFTCPLQAAPMPPPRWGSHINVCACGRIVFPGLPWGCGSPRRDGNYRRVASPGLTASVQRATQTTCVPVKRAATQTDIGSCKYMYRYIYGLYIYLVSALSQAPLAARGRRRRRERERESERVVKG